MSSLLCTRVAYLPERCLVSGTWLVQSLTRFDFAWRQSWHPMLKFQINQHQSQPTSMSLHPGTGIIHLVVDVVAPSSVSYSNMRLVETADLVTVAPAFAPFRVLA